MWQSYFTIQFLAPFILVGIVLIVIAWSGIKDFVRGFLKSWRSPK